MYCTWFLYTHTHPFNGSLFGITGWASTRKVKPICILLKQETVSGSGISWAICKSAPRSRLITMPAPHHSVFYRPNALPAAQPTASKHWRPTTQQKTKQWDEQANWANYVVSQIVKMWREINSKMGYCRMIHCDTRCYFKVCSKTDMSQLNLPHRA